MSGLLRIGPQHYLILAALLFAIGASGVVLRRNALIVLMSIELMLNAVNLTFIAFSRFPLVANSPTPAGFLQGHAAVFFVIAVAAAEAAVGLAIVIALFRRRRTTDVEDASLMRW